MSSLYKSPASRWQVLDDNTITPRPQYDSIVVPYLSTAVITLSTDFTPLGTEPLGATYWDSDNHCVTTVYEFGAKYQHGFELYKVGTDLGVGFPEGTPVSVMGTNGNRIALITTNASPSSTNYSAYIGLVTTSPNGPNRFVTREGAVNGIDTTGGLSFDGLEIWKEDDVIYVDPEHEGYLTNVQPSAPNNCIRVGVVTIAHANQGQIELLRGIGQRFTELCDVNGTALSADGQLATWDNTNKYFDFTDNINNYFPRTLLEATEDPTGFISPEDVIITGDSANRQVTLTETVEAYWQGTRVETLSSGWESPQHETDSTVSYFLLYDGSEFDWVKSTELPSDFYKNLLICWAFYNGSNWVYQRECHSIMQHATHREFHEVVGTYRASGGLLRFPEDYIGSTTPANRRPTVEETLIYDEDLPTKNPELTPGSYTRFWLSGPDGDDSGTFGLDSTDIVALNGNQPYFNQFDDGIWTQTPMSNNSFMSVWVVAIPVAADVESQKHRYVFLQGQNQSGTLSDQQALSPSDLTLKLPLLTPESVFIAKIIIRFQSSNWHIAAVQNITGTRASQVASPAGNYLSVVSTDATINGNGIVANPLTLNPNISGTSLSLTDVTFTGAVSTLETATLSAAEYIIVEVGGIEKAIQLWDF